MKLRLLGSSVRLRVTPQEVEAIGRGERVQSVACFPNGSVLAYALSVVAGDLPMARFADGCIEVQLPRPLAEAWARSDDVGIAAEQPTTYGVFQILVEKDFHAFPPREGDSPERRCSTPPAAAAGGSSPSTPME